MHSTRQLALVAALDRHRHFGRAAEALGLSQPALTKALKALETELGVTLFDRGPPVAPTALGRMVVARAQTLTDGFDDLRREVDLARGLDTGRLNLSVGGHVAEYAAIDAVAALSRAHPYLTCNMWIGDHLSVTADVLEGRADLGVAQISGPARDHPDLTVELLRSAAYVVFCAPGHPLTQRDDKARPDSALFDYPWIGASPLVPEMDYSGAGRRAYGDIDPASGQIRLRLRVNAFRAMLRIVMNSHAISAAPMALIADDVAAGLLVPLRPPPGWPPLEYGIILKRGRTPSPAAEAYMAELRRLEAEFGG